MQSECLAFKGDSLSKTQFYTHSLTQHFLNTFWTTSEHFLNFSYIFDNCSMFSQYFLNVSQIHFHDICLLFAQYFHNT